MMCALCGISFTVDEQPHDHHLADCAGGERCGCDAQVHAGCCTECPPPMVRVIPGQLSLEEVA